MWVYQSGVVVFVIVRRVWCVSCCFFSIGILSAMVPKLVVS